MRFLLFNIAVIAALVYLFLGERAELGALTSALERLPVREEEPASEEDDEAAYLSAETIFGKANATAQSDATADDASASEAWTTLLQELNAEVQIEHSEGPGDAAPSADAEDTDETPGEPSGDRPGNSTDQARLAEGLLPVTDPAVLKRRAEVLEGIEIGGVALGATDLADTEIPPQAQRNAPPVQLAAGERLMNNQERVKQLHGLAEQMEMLFVESLAR